METHNNHITELINDNKFEDCINYCYDNIKDILDNIDEIKDFKKSIIKCLNQYINTTLKSEEEFNDEKRTNTNYSLIIADDDNKMKLFSCYILVYYLDAINREDKCYVGIDYEFANRIIALMQLNFENEIGDNCTNYIWIVNPGVFDDNQMSILIEYLMTNTKIYKIFHGADSLDIPYTFHEMFKNDRDMIDKFTKKFIDTRFLCEYFRHSVGEEKKCSIYEALLYFGTINQDKYNYLEDTHDKMGPVQDISWDIYKLSSFHIKYALYDTIFLRKFLEDIMLKAETETPILFKFYKNLIYLTRFVLLERREVTNIMVNIKKEVDPINNYLVKSNNKNFTLISVLNSVTENLVLPDIGFNLDYIMGVNYFRTHVTFILKNIVYYILTNNFTVHKNKREIFFQKIDIEKMYIEFKDNGLDKLVLPFKFIQNELYKRIIIKLK